MANYADCHGFVIQGIWLLVAIVLPALPTYTSDGGSECFAPGGTRLISISLSCQRLTMEENSSMYPATLYLLREKPQLTGHDEFQVGDAVIPMAINNEEYVYWKFYLYSGSNFSMTCCLYYGINNLYIIQGESNFKSWVDSHDRKYASHYTVIDSFCTSSPDLGGQTMTFYNVTISEEYYFVFYNPIDIGVAILSTSMHFQRTLYEVTSSEIVKRCEAGPTPESYISICSVEVPDNSNYSALVIVGTPQDTTYTDNVHIDWHCTARSQPRARLNAAIVCIPLGVVAVCLAAIVSVCLYWWFRRRKRRYQALMAERVRSNSHGAPPHPLNGNHADSTLPNRCRYSTIRGRETSDKRNISEATTPLQLPCQEVLDPAPMDREPNIVSSESAALSGAAALL